MYKEIGKMLGELQIENDQLKAELEQEKALKETYLACYKAKHEDIEGELFKLKAENDELKKQLMQKSEIDMFFNAPIEGWSNDPCGICRYKQVIEKVREACGMSLCGDDTRSLILEICDEVDGELDQQTIM